MTSANLVNCVACAEEIRSDALLCRFCQTRQDDPQFSRIAATGQDGNSSSEEANPSSSKKTRAAYVGFSVAAIVALSAIIFAGISASRSSTAALIEEAVTAQVYKISVLKLMGPLEAVKCDPVGISIVLPETEYKCFASDAQGKGLIFKANMDWSTGIYQYGLDRG
jgi:hypothetical protein